LIVSEVMRGNETLGNFTAGKFSGLTDIKKVKNEKGGSYRNWQNRQNLNKKFSSFSNR